MAIAALTEGTLLAHGRYRLTGVLARSNFSVTYHARDLRAGGVEVVIKEHACSEACYRDTQTSWVLAHPGQEGLHRQLIERVMREAALLLEVRHPHVVRLDGAWEERGTGYCAMELLPGRTLEDDVRAGGEVPLDGARWARIRAIALEVLEALEAAHARGVYHCDLKPENVLASAGRGAVLIDFGAARTEEQLLRTVTLMPFTPGYAAPELLAPERIREVGPWTDAYSWGMLVYGLASGHPERGAPVDAVRRLLRLSLPSIIDRSDRVDRVEGADGDPYDDAAAALSRRGMPTPWAAALEACLRLDPAQRPQSMAALRALLGEPARAAAIPGASAAGAAEPQTGTPPPVVTTSAHAESARLSGPGLTELCRDLRPSLSTPLPRTLPPPAEAPGAAPRPARSARPMRSAPLALGAAALLLGGALGALFWEWRDPPSAAAPQPALPPSATIEADPAETSLPVSPVSPVPPVPPVSVRGCDPGKFDCDGSCQWLHDPSFGCGRCEPGCKLDHVQQYTCQGQQCAPRTCAPGFDNCDKKAANGCEASMTTDAANCGACGNDCAQAPGVASARCVEGRCYNASCAPNRGECDNVAENGCEVDFATDLDHCGGCNHSCDGRPNVASARCESRECRITCVAPYEDRDGKLENGCEWQPAPPEPAPQQAPLPQLPP